MKKHLVVCGMQERSRIGGGTDRDRVIAIRMEEKGQQSAARVLTGEQKTTNTGAATRWY